LLMHSITKVCNGSSSEYVTKWFLPDVLVGTSRFGPAETRGKF